MYLEVNCFLCYWIQSFQRSYSNTQKDENTKLLLVPTWSINIPNPIKVERAYKVEADRISTAAGYGLWIIILEIVIMPWQSWNVRATAKICNWNSLPSPSSPHTGITHMLICRNKTKPAHELASSHNGWKEQRLVLWSVFLSAREILRYHVRSIRVNKWMGCMDEREQNRERRGRGSKDGKMSWNSTPLAVFITHQI